MTDPIRWSEATNAASSIEQRLVRAGQGVQMPSQEKQAVWQAILSGIPAGVPAPNAAPNTAAASSLTKAAGIASGVSLIVLKGGKIVLLMAALAGLGVGGYAFFKRSTASRNAVPALASATPSAIPISEAPQAVPELVPEQAATVAAPTVQAPLPSRASQLKEESLAVMAARQALRSNDANRALYLLEQAHLKFKRGGLAEEREALTIEALAKLGQTARAAALARSFLNQYPRSPHAADVQRFAK